MSKSSSKPTIGFDFTWMNIPEMDGSGIYQYALRLVQALVEYTDANIVVIRSPASKGGLEAFERLEGSSNFRQVFLKYGGMFGDLIRREGIEIIHSGMQRLFHYSLSLPLVTTLHDLQHFHLPEFFTEEEIEFRNIFFRFSAELAERVIVSYEHVRNDVVRYYSIPPSKVDVCFIGVGKPKSVDHLDYDYVYQKFNLPRKYLFYSANTWRHKNHLNLIKALRLVRESHKIDIDLVCTGHKNPDYFPVLEKEIKSNKLERNIHFLGYVSEDELISLLKKAKLVVIPTLYEAGSYPLMEAMIYEVPVICSNVTSLPGMIGDRRFVFNPTDVQDIADKIVMMLNSHRLRNENRRNSAKRCGMMGWQRSAESFLESYVKAIEGFGNLKHKEFIKRLEAFERLEQEAFLKKEKQLERAVHMRDSVMNSMSWRLTKPLRRMLKTFGKGI